MASKQLTKPVYGLSTGYKVGNTRKLVQRTVKGIQSRESNAPRNRKRPSTIESKNYYNLTGAETNHTKTEQLGMEIVGKVAFNLDSAKYDSIDSPRKYQTLAESTSSLTQNFMLASQSTESLHSPIISTVVSPKISTFTQDSSSSIYAEAKSVHHRVSLQEYKSAVMRSRSVRYASTTGYPAWCSDYILNGYPIRPVSPGDSFNAVSSQSCSISTKAPKRLSYSFFRPSSSKNHKKTLSSVSDCSYSQPDGYSKMSIVNISEVHKRRYEIRPKYRINEQVTRAMNSRYNTLIYDINT